MHTATDEGVNRFVTRWRGIRGVSPTSDDVPTFTRLLDRYGPTALEEVLSQLNLRDLTEIHRPLAYLIGGLRRWEHARRQADLEQQRTATAISDTQAQLTTEDQRKAQISLHPPAQFAMMRELWAAAQEMAAAGVSADEKERILQAMATGAIGLPTEEVLPEAAPFLPAGTGLVKR